MPEPEQPEEGEGEQEPGTDIENPDKGETEPPVDPRTEEIPPEGEQ